LEIPFLFPPPAVYSDRIVACGPFELNSLFGWLVADGWCWFVLREEYCWLVADGWFVLREKCCWLVADKPCEQGENEAACEEGPCSADVMDHTHLCP
jgi:hypothetical protein